MCEELAERLESAGVAYGAIELDWLGWFNAPELDAAAVQRTYLDNLAAVTANYADAGVRRLVLAGAVRSNAVLDATRAAVPFELRVVRLTLPLDEIERRLSDAVTVGRARDVRNASRWLDVASVPTSAGLSSPTIGRFETSRTRSCSGWAGYDIPRPCRNLTPHP